MAQNYENLYADLQDSLKKIKDCAKAITSAGNKSTKDIEIGELKDFENVIETLRKQAAALSEAADKADEVRKSFNVDEYFASGDFAEQMKAYCNDANMDVHAEGNVYEMFPSKVVIESNYVTLDRKKYAGIRPKVLIDKIRENQEKLNKQNFNPKSFAKELVDAYDTVLAKSKKKPGSDVALLTLYQAMTPMARLRKAYDFQASSFDVARLKKSGLSALDNGRTFDFGSGSTKNPVRYLDDNGKEHLLHTFFSNEKFEL